MYCSLVDVLVSDFQNLIMFVLQASQARLQYLSQLFKKPSDAPENVTASESPAKPAEEGQWIPPPAASKHTAATYTSSETVSGSCLATRKISESLVFRIV